MSEPIPLTVRDGAVRFAVRVVPRANQSAFDGTFGTALRVRLAAPPVDGAANDELVRFLAAELGVKRANVRIVSGNTSRSKTVEVSGVSSAVVSQKIELRGRKAK